MKSKKIILSILSIGLTFQLLASEKTNVNKDLGISTEKLLPAPSLLKTNKTKADAVFGHVIKINASQLAIKNISLQYEFAFHKNMSVALGYSNFLKRSIPKQIYNNDKADGYQLPYMKGFAITPEFRFYPGKKEEKPAPHGFYLAPYMRYSKYTLGADYIQIDSTGTIRKYELSGSYKGSTFGLMIGSQWIVGKHFSFDWWILGAGYGGARLVLEASSDDINLNGSQQDELRGDIIANVDELGRFSNGMLTVETTSNSAKATLKGLPMLSLRGMLFCGFNFGYKF